MKKLKQLLKESYVWERNFGDKLPTLADIQKKKNEGGPGSGPQDDDNPFDKEPTDDELADIEKQFEGKLNEVDFEKIKLPSQVNRFLGRFVQSMKDANLNRIKRSAILYKVIDASGMSIQQLMADVQKIKRKN